MRSGWKASRPLGFSLTPTNLIGLPVICRTDSAAPPRASPSSLVRMMPVSGKRVAEGLGGIHRILAGHRIDHEQGLDGLQRGMQFA